MIKITYILMLWVIIQSTQAQTNTFPATGSVGIGTTNPLEKFQIGDRLTFHDGGSKVIGYNRYWNNGPKRIVSGSPASLISFTELGEIHFASSPSGNANEDLSSVEKINLLVANNGNVSIGGVVPTEKLTLAGNLLLTGIGYPKIQLANRFMLQVPISVENSYTRSIVSQNISWNESTNKWVIPDQMYADFSLVRFENSGVIGFYNRSSGPTEMTNDQLEAYRRLTISDNGYVGIGTRTPYYGLHIATGDGSGAYGGASILVENGIGFKAVDNFNSGARIIGKRGARNSRDLAFITGNDGGGDAERMTIQANSGNVGIGTTTPQAKLAVNGDIFSKKVKVTQTAWPDYVFHTTYRLRPLSEVEQYIQQHHHLPEVPSAEEVAKDGLDLGDNQAVLLKKIEELTLYVIEQNKKHQQLEQKVHALREENEQLQELLKNIKSTKNSNNLNLEKQL